MLEKVWAEYLTVGVTVSFLPLEMYRDCAEAGLVPGGDNGDQSTGAGVPVMAVATEEREAGVGRVRARGGCRSGSRSDFRFYFAYQIARSIRK